MLWFRDVFMDSNIPLQNKNTTTLRNHNTATLI